MTDLTEQPWDQAVVEFSGWDSAERVAATVLAPRLRQRADVAGWWFIRKHPCWRIRYQLAPGAADEVSDILGELTATGIIASWQRGIYEPEALAFGGPAGIRIAHQLFCADTTGILAHPGGGSPGRKEMSVLLCAALMRAAGLDWFEQGDTWHRVSVLRPLPASTAIGQHADAIRVLLTAGTAPGRRSTADGPLAGAADWITGFRDAGQALATLGRNGELQRGLRDILAHHVIFHWNRCGLASTAQAILARAAQDVILGTATPAPAGNS